MENLIILNDVALPFQLLEATEKVVKAGKAKSRNELIARALRKELAAIKRAEIDAELAEMANDPEYQTEVLQMEAEFANASWEAWQIGESEYEKG
ncbi:CopG family transcriptional regulator [Floridanema evergladense]|uniref:CopG family transcriptional regulator n=1 Tax=Floridaenema evergladense BLCC-F167 TaxID=3153639 RepID=A0ABV4WIV5_9CYAN